MSIEIIEIDNIEDLNTIIQELETVTGKTVTVIDRRFMIEENCEFCKVKAELRPYGPNRENICFGCAMKDEATTEKQMSQQLFSDRFDS